MKIELLYGRRAACLPVLSASVTDKATKKDLRVLLALSAMPLADLDKDTVTRRLSAELSLSEGDVENALAFWRGAEVVGFAEEESETPPKIGEATAKKKVLDKQRGLPSYTSGELADIAERTGDFEALIGACQQSLGKMFNTAEIAIIAGMVDDLGFDGEYILLLLSHCARMGKKSLRYAERMAISLYDEEVTDAAALEARLRSVEEMAEVTGAIRSMFGFSSRALSAKEKKMIERWVCGMKYGMDVIRLAYDATVDAIHEPSMSYTNTILERWYAAGLKSVSEVQKSMKEYRQKKQGNSSFDIDDFFSAALKNTYGEE